MVQRLHGVDHIWTVGHSWCRLEESHHFSVPQGSVLGPQLFTLYVRPIKDIIIRHGFKYHVYADDIQLYLSCQPNQVDQVPGGSA